MTIFTDLFHHLNPFVTRKSHLQTSTLSYNYQPFVLSLTCSNDIPLLPSRTPILEHCPISRQCDQEPPGQGLPLDSQRYWCSEQLVSVNIPHPFLLAEPPRATMATREVCMSSRRQVGIQTDLRPTTCEILRNVNDRFEKRRLELAAGGTVSLPPSICFIPSDNSMLVAGISFRSYYSAVTIGRLEFMLRTTRSTAV